MADEAGQEVNEDIESLDGALDNYNITFNRLGELLDKVVFSEEAIEKMNKKMNVGELRKFMDMILKMKGGYKPVQHSIDKTVTFSWEGEDEFEAEPSEDEINQDIESDMV